MKQYAYLVAGALLSTGCNSMLVSSQDMQGYNPQEYYAKEPVENKVEIRHALYTVQYPSGQDKLSSSNIDELKLAFSDVSPEAAESVRIRLSPAQFRNEIRKENLAKFLRNMGYSKRLVRFESASSVQANEADIDITYAAVVLPRCPDWRTSPTTTHSNTKQANIGCSSVVNLGLMVADPHDLVRGEGASSPDSERNSMVIRRYRQGMNPAGTETTGSSQSGSGSAEPNTAAPTSE